MTSYRRRGGTGGGDGGGGGGGGGLALEAEETEAEAEEEAERRWPAGSESLKTPPRTSKSTARNKSEQRSEDAEAIWSERR